MEGLAATLTDIREHNDRRKDAPDALEFSIETIALDAHDCILPSRKFVEPDERPKP